MTLEDGKVPCKWCEREFYPEHLTLEGFCSDKCEAEWKRRNARKRDAPLKKFRIVEEVSLAREWFVEAADEVDAMMLFDIYGDMTREHVVRSEIEEVEEVKP